MSSLLSYNPRNSKLQENRKARLVANSFGLIVTINMLTGFYLVLISFRHLADHSASLDYITVSLFQAVMLMTLTVAAHLVKNVARQRTIAVMITFIPWIFIVANIIFSQFGEQF